MVKSVKALFEAMAAARKPADPIALGKAYSAEHFHPFFERFPKAFRNVYCGADCGKGWLKLITPLIELCEQEDVEIHQIKEKFGGLRFYVDTASQTTYQIIEDTEGKSFTICERCGADGKRRGGGWIKTLCDRCENDRATRTDWDWWNDLDIEVE